MGDIISMLSKHLSKVLRVPGPSDSNGGTEELTDYALSPVASDESLSTNRSVTTTTTTTGTENSSATSTTPHEPSRDSYGLRDHGSSVPEVPKQEGAYYEDTPNYKLVSD